MATYLIGARIRLSVTVTNVSTEAKLDPNNLTLTIRNLDTGENTALVYGVDTDVIRDGVGEFHYDLTPDDDGHYAYRWSCTGTVTDAVEDTFLVEASQVVAP